MWGLGCSPTLPPPSAPYSSTPRPRQSIGLCGRWPPPAAPCTTHAHKHTQTGAQALLCSPAAGRLQSSYEAVNLWPSHRVEIRSLRSSVAPTHRLTSPVAQHKHSCLHLVSPPLIYYPASTSSAFSLRLGSTNKVALSFESNTESEIRWGGWWWWWWVSVKS